MSTSGNFAKPSLTEIDVLQILSLFLEHSKESHIFQPKRELAGKNGFSIQLLFSCIPPCIGDGRRDHFAIRKWVPKQIAYWVLNERERERIGLLRRGESEGLIYIMLYILENERLKSMYVLPSTLSNSEGAIPKRRRFRYETTLDPKRRLDILYKWENPPPPRHQDDRVS